MKISKLKEKYRSKSIETGSLYLLTPEDSINFIQDGVEMGLKFVGVEGFKVFKKNERVIVQPFQEHSNDIAYEEMTDDDFVATSLDFINERKALDLWFEVVFAKSSDR